MVCQLLGVQEGSVLRWVAQGGQLGSGKGLVHVHVSPAQASVHAASWHAVSCRIVSTL